MPPLLLEDDEAVAIAVGLRSTHAVAGVEEASVRALAKLEQVLPSRLRTRVANIGAATVPVPGDGPAVDPELLAVLAGAITNRERLRFRYREDKRHVEPHRLVSARRHWYLLAFDLERDDWRVFRVDRMYSLAPTYEMDVTLRMPAGQVPDGLGTVTPVGEGSCRLRTAGDTLDWLALRVALLGCEFEVHSPPELVTHLRELGMRVLRSVGNGADAEAPAP